MGSSISRVFEDFVLTILFYCFLIFLSLIILALVVNRIFHFTGTALYYIICSPCYLIRHCGSSRDSEEEEAEIELKRRKKKKKKAKEAIDV